MLAAMELVITLLVIGAILLLLETVLPGMIAGIIGGCCLLAGIVIAYRDLGAQAGTWILFGTIAALIVGFCVWAKFFPTSRFGRIFISTAVSGEIRNEQPQLLHQTGKAATQLRPSGAAIINGTRVDVVSEGSHIEKGTPIKVIAIEGLRVVVRADGPSPSPEPTETKTTHS